MMHRLNGAYLFSYLLVMIGMSLLFAAELSAADVRTWTDAGGKNKLEAAYVSHANGKVTLKGANGRTYEIELTQLSAADQKYIKDLEDNPFKEASPSKDSSPFKESMPATAAAPKSISPSSGKSDWSNSTLLPLVEPESGWSCRLTEDAGQGLSFKPKNFPLTKSAEGEWIKGFEITPDGKRGVLTYEQTFEKITRLAVVDLSGGRIVASSTLSSPYRALAINNSGNQVLARSNLFGFGNQGELFLFQVQGKELVQVAKFTPYSALEKSKQNIVWGDFVGENRLAVLGDGGRLSIWDAAELQPLCHFDLQMISAAVASPDRRVVAFADHKQVGLIDVESQRFLGLASIPDGMHPRQMAFSPSGKRFAAIGSSRIIVWETATGNVISDFPLLGLAELNVSFVQENFLLISNRYLVDLDNQLKLWAYMGPQQAAATRGTTFMALQMPGSAGLMYAGELPHLEALQVLQQAMTQPDMFLVKPGGTVSLDVSRIPGQYQQQVREQLTKRLQAMDISVADGALGTFVASIEGPRTRDVVYGQFGMLGGTTVPVQESISKVEISWQGKSAWSQQASNVPGSVSWTKDQSLQQAVNEMTSQPNLKFFDTVRLPKVVQKPSGDDKSFGQTLGKSTMTATGMQ